MKLTIAIDPTENEVDLIFNPSFKAGQKIKVGDKEAAIREKIRFKGELAKLLSKSFQMGRDYETEE